MDKLSSFRKCEAHLRDNLAALSGLPMLVNLHTALGQLIAKIDTLDGDLIYDSSGYALDKKEKRRLLADTLLRLARYAHVHYVLTSNADMEALVAKIMPRTIARFRDADLYLFAQKTYQALLPDAAAMPGSAPADIVLLQAQTAAYFDAIHAPATVRAERKAVVAEIIVLMRQAEQLCKQIEIYMRTLIYTNENLYLLWRAARNTDRTGVRPKKKKDA